MKESCKNLPLPKTSWLLLGLLLLVQTGCNDTKAPVVTPSATIVEKEQPMQARSADSSSRPSKTAPSLRVHSADNSSRPSRTAFSFIKKHYKNLKATLNRWLLTSTNRRNKKSFNKESKTRVKRIYTTTKEQDLFKNLQKNGAEDLLALENESAAMRGQTETESKEGSLFEYEQGGVDENTQVFLKEADKIQEKFKIEFEKGTNGASMLAAYYLFINPSYITPEFLQELYDNGADFNARLKYKDEIEAKYDVSIMGLLINRPLADFGLIQKCIALGADMAARQKVNYDGQEYDLSTLGLLIKERGYELEQCIQLIEESELTEAESKARQKVKHCEQEYDLSTLGLTIYELSCDDDQRNKLMKILYEKEKDFKLRQKITDENEEYDLSTLGFVIEKTHFKVDRCMELTDMFVRLGANLTDIQLLKGREKERNMSLMDFVNSRTTRGAALKEKFKEYLEKPM